MNAGALLAMSAGGSTAALVGLCVRVRQHRVRRRARRVWPSLGPILAGPGSDGRHLEGPSLMTALRSAEGGLLGSRTGMSSRPSADRSGFARATPDSHLTTTGSTAPDRRAKAGLLAEPGRADRRERLLPTVASGVVGLGAALLVNGMGGWMLGVVLASAGLRWLPTPPSSAQQRQRRERVALRGQLPLAADLLAGCLASWCPPDVATAAVATAIPQPMAGRLAAAATELAMGADPETCWERFGATEPALAPLGRCLARAAASGAPPVAGLARLADAERAAAAREAQARVRRAGVLATAPLGLCFLPAFVLTGVVPVVTGLAGSFLHRI